MSAAGSRPSRASIPTQACLGASAHTGFDFGYPAHRAETNPIERRNHDVKRCADVVGIFPNEASLRQLVGAALLEQNDEWAVQHAPYMPCDTMAELLDPPSAELAVMAH